MRFLDICKPVFAASLLTMSLQAATFAQSVSPLEQLFIDKNTAEFEPRALKEAAAGSAEANFLLGKAYHLGMGVQVNKEEAAKWYRVAVKLGSARAANNLGMMALYADDRPGAIALLNQALAKGLKMPTLINLGTAHSPENPDDQSQLKPAIKSALKAASYFEQAYAIDNLADTAALAANEYFKVWDYHRISLHRREVKPADLEAARARAVKWLTMAMDKGSAHATVLLGTLLRIDGKTKEAEALLTRAAASGNGAAHYQMGELTKTRDTDVSVRHYEAAAKLNYSRAKDDVLEHHQNMLDSGDEDDPAKLRAAAAKLQAIHPTMFSEQVREWRADATAAETRKAAHAKAAALPRLPIRLNACGLLPGQAFYRPSLTRTAWTLKALKRDGRSHKALDIGGTLDKGCARMSEPLPPNVRMMVADGAYLWLDFGSHLLPLDMVAGAQEITLQLHPVKPGED